MSETTNNFIKIGKVILDDNAFNYEIRKEDVDKNAQSIFEHYDTSKDGILDSDELGILKKDIEEANSSKLEEFDKSEEQALLNKISPKGEIKIKNLNTFFKNMQKIYTNHIETVSDGTIDNFEQADRVGNCWLLQEAMSLSSTDWGKDIIKNSISVDEEKQCYVINFDGVGAKVELSFEEVEKSNPKSKNIFKNIKNAFGTTNTKGDIDIRILEMAVKKYFKDNLGVNNIYKDGQSIASERSLHYLLTGYTGTEYNIPGSEPTYNDELMIKLGKNSKQYAMGCTFRNKKEWDNKKLYKKEESFSVQNGHAFTIKEIVVNEEGFPIEVILKNPWNSKKDIHKSYQEFMDQVDFVWYLTNDGKDI